MGFWGVRVFESLRGRSRLRFIPSGVNEAAFELDAAVAGHVQFLGAAETLLICPVQGLRARQTGGGTGAGAAG